MTALRFDDEGVDVEYEGTAFRLEREMIEEATAKRYWDVTDHELLSLIDPDPDLSGQPRQISDILD